MAKQTASTPPGAFAIGLRRNHDVAEDRKQAVLVVHGMGEQRPMQTLRALAETLSDDRKTFIIPDQATGSAELARIRVSGRPLSENLREPATDFYELFYADLLGGGTFAQLRGWVIGLMLRWPHQVPREVWKIWVFLWAVVLGTLAWLGPFLAGNPLDDLKKFLASAKGNPTNWQVALLVIIAGLLCVWMSQLALKHVNNANTKPNINRSLPTFWTFLAPAFVSVSLAYVAFRYLPWAELTLPASVACASGIYLECGFDTFWGLLSAKWFQILAAALVWVAVSRFGVPYFGDVARYVGASNESIQGRQAIRERGLKLLTELHDRRANLGGAETRKPEYERILIIAHSLGTIVAYDVMRIYWAKHNINNFGKVPAAALKAMQDMAETHTYDKIQTDEQHNALVGLQNSVHLAMRGEENAWRISDFITMGSPLARADFLMARDWPRFQKNIVERQYPTCPPVLDKKGFTYDNQKAGGPVPHHAAMFCATRWLAIYDPIRKLIFGGDFIGGPVKSLFGHGISQLAVKITRPGLLFPNIVTHTNYWQQNVKTKLFATQSQLPSDLQKVDGSGQIIINALRKRIWTEG